MVKAADRALAAGLGLLSIVTITSDTDARPRRPVRHVYHPIRTRVIDQATRERGSSPAGQRTAPHGPFGALIEQIVRDCGREVAELKSFPLDAIAQSISPDDAQDAALKNIRSMAGTSADTLAQSCAEQIPAAPVSRLDTVDRGLEAVQSALNTLQTPLQSFYESLQEEQKARVIVKYIIARGEIGLFDATSAIRARPASPAEPQKGSAPAPRVWSCEQLEAGLRAWPIMKIEQAVQLWPRQYSAFYELAASVHHAADTIAESCPRDAALTPTGRLDEVRKKLDAVRQLTRIIRSHASTSSWTTGRNPASSR
jgi:LTXXQ motif family protein